MRRSCLSVGVCVAAWSMAAPVLAHDGDIGIRISGGRLETVLASGEPPAQVFGNEIERVFAAELGWNPVTSEVVTDEPGLASAAAGLLGRSLGFNIRSSLRRWDGSTFSPTIARMSVGGSDLGLPFVSTPVSDVLTAGPSIVVPQVPLDVHLDWRLDGATRTTGLGIYLMELEVTNPGGVLVSSDPLWIVYNHGEDERVHDEAIAYVAANLAPSPSAGLVTMGVAGIMAVRRRR